MDEMTAVRDVRAAAPLPDAARLAAGRRALVDAADASQAPAGRFPRAVRALTATRPRRTVLAGLTAAAVAAGVLVAAGPGGAGDLSSRSVADVMEAAATHAAARSGSVPAARQWEYDRTLHCTVGICYPVVHWYRFDGKQSASADPLARVPANVVVSDWGRGHDPAFATWPQEVYARLAALPAEPRALLARLKHDPTLYLHVPCTRTPWSSGEAVPASALQEFMSVANLLTLPPSLVPPRTSAALYRALALVPGVRLVGKPVKDAAGRTGVAVEFTAPPGSPRYGQSPGSPGKALLPVRIVVILDARTYAYLGAQEDFDKDHAGMSLRTAALADGVVAHPGQWPGGPVPAPSAIRVVTQDEVMRRAVVPKR